MTHQGQTTLAEAVAGEPAASWTDDAGTLWTSDQILKQWPQDKLDATVVWGEGQMSMPTIRSADGRVLLTMEPPTGLGVPSEPPVRPEDEGL
ncbi:MAG TPA: hypothetical protein VFB58_02005 [Chloroflexota bacterium]|nr:hypothetical protein [Chloroflexota bacterium]